MNIQIRADSDIVEARQKGRELALQIGFTPAEGVLIATVISELARNILLYAKQGEIVLNDLQRPNGRGIEIVAGDRGPGIADIAQALQDGFSTSGGLGLGLPGVKRLMDEFNIISEVGQGTTVTVKKWKR